MAHQGSQDYAEDNTARRSDGYADDIFSGILRYSVSQPSVFLDRHNSNGTFE
jgi:hypothetical protein